MAKFRMNHARQGKGGGSSTIIRVGIFAALLSGLFFVYNIMTGGKAGTDGWSNDRITPADTVDDRSYYLPAGGYGEVVHHDFFSLSYDEEHEQAEWVAYVLTRNRVNSDKSDRRDDFREDPLVRTGSATLADYRGSGYDRGHLVPAGDMAFDPAAMNETFYLSNISPMARDFNTGIWRELEANVQSWARQHKKIYVISGPILNEPGKGSIGEQAVTIPNHYYKVVLDLSEPGLKGIGFILPNTLTYEPLHTFAVSIDEVEQRTGLNFFPDLMPRDLETDIESKLNLDLWPFSKAAHNQRLGQ